jgi:hypothetical protein
MKLKDVLLEDTRWHKARSGKGVLTRTITADDRARIKEREEMAALKKKHAAWEKAEEKRKARYDARKFTNDELTWVAREIENVVGNVVPDGDPIDWLAPKIKKKFGIEYCADILNQAAKKILGYKGYYPYLADMWQQYHDQEEDDSGKPDPQWQNPWK